MGVNAPKATVSAMSLSVKQELSIMKGDSVKKSELSAIDYKE